MNFGASLKACCLLALLTVASSLVRPVLRRVHRQVPASIPYASLSTGQVPPSLRNRLRGSSSSAGSRQSSTSDSSSGVNSGSSYGSTPLSSGNSGYSSYGDGASGGQSYGQTQYGQQGARVPVGSSTYPYGTGQITGNFQNPYANQPLPMPSMPQYGGRGSTPQYQQPQQPMGYNPQMQYNPYSGYNNHRTGGNPYGGYQYSGGTMSQPVYPSYGGSTQGRGAYYGGGGYGGGGGRGGGGYSSSYGGAAIGSPYRDPNSPFTSYLHPDGDSASSYGGTSSSYGTGYGTGRGGSSRYSSNRYSDGSDSSRGGYSRGRGSSYYGSSSSSSRYGQSRPSGSSDRYSSGGGSYGGGSYGGNSGQYNSGRDNSNPYGSSGGSYYSSSYGQSGSSRYGSTPGSDGSTSDSRYGQSGDSRYSSTGGGYGGYGQTSTSRQYGADGQPSYQNYDRTSSGTGGDGQSSYQTYDRTSSGTGGDGQSSYQNYDRTSSGTGGGASSNSFYNPVSPLPGSDASSSSRYSQYSPSVPENSNPSTSGRFFNPGPGTSDSRSQTPGISSSQYQSGRFHNPQAGVGGVPQNPSVPIASGGSTATANSTSDYRPQADSPYVVQMRDRDGPREDESVITSRRRGQSERGHRRKHPAVRRCEPQDEGLPDLIADHTKMLNSVIIDRKHRSQLTCAISEGCLPASATARHASPWRKLLRFATYAFNNGTAVFEPDLHPSEWKYHSCHNHYHSMKEFAHFYLTALNGTVLGEGHKVSFCLEDSSCKNPCKKKYKCDKVTQGISPGCSDVYLASRDCQWIDVTDVQPGVYILRVALNPLVDGMRAVPELSYTNNVAECKVTIGLGLSVKANSCWMK